MHSSFLRRLALAKRGKLSRDLQYQHRFRRQEAFPVFIPRGEAIHNSSNTTMAEQASEKPVVFLLNLDKGQVYEGLFDSMYSNLVHSLAAKYRLQRARTLSAAQRYLSDPANQPIAILLPDPAVALEENSAILEQVKSHVKAGGIAIFAATFSSFISPPALDEFWEKTWGLRWKYGSYHRTDVHLNRYAA
jgi:hypothetical protein